MTADRYRDLRAAGVITQRELEVLELRLRFSQYVVARGLHISRSTVRSIERNAHDKIARHSRKDAA